MESESTMLRGFRDFLLRGNVLDLAVAVIIGGAFGAIVTSFAEDVITPIITSVGGAPDYSNLRLGPILIGNLLNAIISFVITALIVYFVFVLPMNNVMARFKPKEPDPQPTRECPECLSNIPTAARRCSFCTSQVTPVSPRSQVSK